MSVIGGGRQILLRAAASRAAAVPDLRLANPTACASTSAVGGGAGTSGSRRIHQGEAAGTPASTPSKESKSHLTTGPGTKKSDDAKEAAAKPKKLLMLRRKFSNGPSYGGLNGLDDASAKRERNRTVHEFYNQTAIDEAAAKLSVRLTPHTIMYVGSNESLVTRAQFLHKELPVRVAHRIAGIRELPFIVGCNPTILAVHELYMRSFHMLSSFPPIETEEDEKRYATMLKLLLEDHKDVVTQLAQGFKECRKHIKARSFSYMQ